MLPSYCRVTGKSRNLPKPNYFPLLPPISPAEAKRLCRLTGKSQSLEEHHYIPVIEFGRESRALQCHIVQNSSGNENHHFNPLETFSDGQNNTVDLCRITAKHVINASYRYVFPILDTSKLNKEIDYLKNVLKKMEAISSLPKDYKFVYGLPEDHVNLVLPFEMEEAVRSGEIESLMLSKDGTKTLLRLKHGRSVSMPMKQMSQEELLSNKPDDLYIGAGQDSEVLAKQRKIRAYKKRKTSDSFLGCRRKFFEDKDKANEEVIKLVKKPKLKNVKENSVPEEEDQQVLNADWQSRMAYLGACQRSATNLLVIGTDWRDLVYPKAENFDWDSFPKLDDVPETKDDFSVYSVTPVQVKLEELSPGPLQGKPVITEDTVGFEAVPVYETVQAFSAKPPSDITQAVSSLQNTKSVNLKELFGTSESLMFLPFIHEVGSVAENIESGKPGYVIMGKNATHFSDNPPADNGTDSVKGIMLKLGEDERFIIGETISLAGKEVFVPGQNITNTEGMQYLTGITVQTPEGPGFIPGFIFNTQHGKRFVAGQFMETENGREFVAGQAMQTLFGPKFLPGQTIQTAEGLKFAVGQVRGKELMPGQVLITTEGPKFVPGQTFDTPQGARFVAGQVYKTKYGDLDFIPGQNLPTDEGNEFVPGQTIETPDGPIFIPGQNLKTPSGVKFVPGAQIRQPNGQIGFVPGETMITNEGRQFIAGRIISTENGPKFVPGKLEQVGEFDYQFAIASSEEEVYVASGLNEGLPIDNATFTALPWEKPDLGYMVQLEENVHFLSTEQNPDVLEKERFVSGQLLKTEETPRFVPGKIIETAIGSRFIPGQIVKTNKGEQFVPGQVVETKYGPKFVPGQVVETKDGKKFVPGQVFEGKKGPRFVPGQILHTKYGPTFIPGQVVYTDEGSRFVPGHVVETSAGPRFVPGQVVDLGNAVRFVCGQIVETENGPYYVAPDIDETNEEFSVQGFEVTPEELRLITAYPFAALHYPLTDEPIIDSRMLHQMAAAGVAVNRHTSGRLYDLKIFDPTDTDESILGANAFRMVDPLSNNKKNKKKKEEQNKMDTEQEAVQESSGLSGNSFDGTTTSMSQPGQPLCGENREGKNSALTLEFPADSGNSGSNKQFRDQLHGSGNEETNDDKPSKDNANIGAKSKNRSDGLLDGSGAEEIKDSSKVGGNVNAEWKNEESGQKSDGSHEDAQHMGQNGSSAPVLGNQKGLQDTEQKKRNFERADGKQTIDELCQSFSNGCKNDFSSSAESNYVSKENSEFENKTDSQARKDTELVPEACFTPDNLLYQRGIANSNSIRQISHLKTGESSESSSREDLRNQKKYPQDSAGSDTGKPSSESSDGSSPSELANGKTAGQMLDQSRNKKFLETESNDSVRGQSILGTDFGNDRGSTQQSSSDESKSFDSMNKTKGRNEGQGTNDDASFSSINNEGFRDIFGPESESSVPGNSLPLTDATHVDLTATGDIKTFSTGESSFQNGKNNTSHDPNGKQSSEGKMESGGDHIFSLDSETTCKDLSNSYSGKGKMDANEGKRKCSHPTGGNEEILGMFSGISRSGTTNQTGQISAFDGLNTIEGIKEKNGTGAEENSPNSSSSRNPNLGEENKVFSRQGHKQEFGESTKKQLESSPNGDSTGDLRNRDIANRKIDGVTSDGVSSKLSQEFQGKGQGFNTDTTLGQEKGFNSSHPRRDFTSNHCDAEDPATERKLQNDGKQTKKDAKQSLDASDSLLSANSPQGGNQDYDPQNRGLQGSHHLMSEIQRSSLNVNSGNLKDDASQKTFSQNYDIGTVPEPLQGDDSAHKTGLGENKMASKQLSKTNESNLKLNGGYRDQQNSLEEDKLLREKKAHVKLLSKLLGKEAPADDDSSDTGCFDTTANPAENMILNNEERNEDVATEDTVDVQLAKFFKKIKSDLECVEKDPTIRDTLAEAAGWASAIGRNDLAEKVQNLMDILKNTENDPEVAGIIKEILVLKQIAAGDKEAQLLLKQIKEDPNSVKRSPDRLHKYRESVTKHTTLGRRRGKPKKSVAKHTKIFTQPTVSELSKSQKAEVVENSVLADEGSRDPNTANGLENKNQRNANGLNETMKTDSKCISQNRLREECSTDAQKGQKANGGILPKSEEDSNITNNINSSKNSPSSTAEVTSNFSTSDIRKSSELVDNCSQENGKTLSDTNNSTNVINTNKKLGLDIQNNSTNLITQGLYRNKNEAEKLSALVEKESSGSDFSRKLDDPQATTEGNNRNGRSDIAGGNPGAASVLTVDSNFSGKGESLRSDKQNLEATDRRLAGRHVAPNDATHLESTENTGALQNNQSVLETAGSKPNKQQLDSDKETVLDSGKKREGRKTSRTNGVTDYLPFENRSIAADGTQDNDAKSNRNSLDETINEDKDSVYSNEDASKVNTNSLAASQTWGGSENCTLLTQPNGGMKNLRNSDSIFEPDLVSEIATTDMAEYQRDDKTSKNGLLENGQLHEENIVSRRPPVNPRKISSRRSSVTRHSSGSDDNMEGISDIPLPEVIQSSKDIPKEIIDTLRYSTDESKKELYTKKLLEALGCIPENDSPSPEPGDEYDDDEMKRNRSRIPSRKSSACIILKDFLQTIIPQNAARGVLVGDINYMVIDEDGVRYFESAGEFASRRSSRFDIRQSRRSRSGSADEDDSVNGPWPWADTAPRSRRSSVGELRRRLRLSEVVPPSPIRSRSGDRRARYSVASAPLSRSSSGYITPISDRTRSRRQSFDVDHMESITEDESRRSLRQRKLGVVDSSSAHAVSARLSALELNKVFSALEDIATRSESRDNDGFLMESSFTRRLGASRLQTSDIGDDDIDFDDLDHEVRASILDNSAALHKLAVRPKKRHLETRNRSPRPEDETTEVVEGSKRSRKVSTDKTEELRQTTYRRTRSGKLATTDPSTKREAVIRELVETEDEFISDMDHVVSKYYRQMDLATTPRHVRDQREAIFGPFKQIQEFHKSVLLEGLKYYTDQPRMIGRTFLRLERDFDKHAQYCELEPKAQALLKDDKDLKEYFEEYSQQIGDTKNLSEHLQLPVQRINDYQVLLKDLISHCGNLEESSLEDLHRAHELMLSLPQRKSDFKFIGSIAGYKGNLHKLGRLLRHDWFSVCDSRGRARDRYLFLFKARILVTKVRRVTEDRNIFLLKDIIKLPDVEIRDPDPESLSFELLHTDPRFTRYPLTLKTTSKSVRDDWLNEIRQYAADAIALAEHADDDLQVDGPSDADADCDQADRGPQPQDLTTKPAEEPLIEQTKSEESILPSKSNPTDNDSLLAHSEPKMTEPEAENPGNRPRFARTLRSVLCEPGEKAIFDCVVEFDPVGAVTWLRNNRPLDDRWADRVRVTVDKKHHKLELMNCRLEDSGMYTALAINEEGSSSCSAQLIVQELTPEEREKMAQENSPAFLVRLKDTELVEGAAVRFLIKVKGDPLPDIEFRKDKKKLKFDDRVKLVTEHAASGSYELVISSVVPEDAGIYTCAALNRFGEVVCEANVTVTNEKAVFALLDNQRTAEPGEPTIFNWFRNGVEFDPEDRFKVLFQEEEDTLALVFQHVKPEDAGLYTCVAATSSGKISCSAELSVQGAVYQLQHEPEPPTVIMDLTDTEVSCGGSAMMELKIKGYPKPQIAWFKAGQEVKAGGRYRFLYEDEESIALIIKGVTMDDAGLYTVVAKNDLGEVTTEGRLYVKAPPKFKKKMSDMACMTDEPFKMQVEVEGSPAPELKWYKDGQLIIESERIKIVKESEESFSLVIERVTVEDTGSYSVVASNAMGQMSEFWHMVANSPPAFLQELLKNLEKDEGEDITFEVKVQGSPKPNVTWMKDGKELKHDGKRVTIKEDGSVHTLSLSGIKRGDAGRYCCQISNSFGTEEDSATLKVRSAPQLVENLKDIEAKEGEKNVAFTVKAEGYPAPQVKWFIDEIEITEERKEFIRIEESDGVHKLTLKEVKSELSGKYSVQLKNDLGSTKSSAILSVMYEPKLESPQKDISVEEGKSAKLSVKCRGVPEPKIQWFKNGQEVSADARIKIKKDDVETYSLTFTACLPEDQGVYEARLSNCVGEVTTKCALSVDTKPRIISDNFSSKEIYEEEEIYFEVQATGQPKPQATWTLNDQVITKSEHVEIYEESDKYKLYVKSSTMSDTGKYSVKLSNKLGEESKTETVTVKSLAELRVPKILRGLSDTEVVKGKPVELSVKVRGQPAPNVEWFKDGVKITSGGDYIISFDETECSYTLVVPSVNENQSGKYTVKATNPHGSDESSASLTVVYQPIITGMKDIVIDYGTEAIFKIVIDSNPQSKTQWLKNNIKIVDTEKITVTSDGSEGILKISSVTKEDEGTYSVVAKNKQGETKAEAKLQVHTEAPALVKKPKSVFARPGETAKFSAVVKGIPQPAVVWLKNGQEVKASEMIAMESSEDSHTFKLVIKNIEELDYAEYTIKAVNVAGEESAKAELTLTSEPPSLGQELEKLTKITEGELLKLVAKVNGSPLPEVKWYKDNEEIIPDERIKIQLLPDGSATLEIANALPTDSGNFRMIATNPSGKIATQTSVDVERKTKKPTLEQGLEPQVSVIQGQPLKLTAKVSGYPKPEVQWTKDGRPVRSGSHVAISTLPDGTLTLEIDRVKPEDAGKYAVTVTNELGKAESASGVVVEPPPSAPFFSCPLFPVKATEGFPVRMEAKVSGYPLPEITWLKDGHPFKPDASRVTLPDKPEADGTVRMVIEKSLPEDAGEYTAVANNPHGENQTAAKVAVNPRVRDGEQSAPFFVTPLRDVNVDEGTPLRLTAVSGGNPVPDVFWRLNGEHISNEKGLIEFDGDKLSLDVPKCSMSDAGDYEVILKNSLGEAKSGSHVSIRKIYQPPVFTQKFTDLQQLPTYDAKFLGKVSGIPKPEVSWSFSGSPISDSGKYKIKRDGDISVLFIRDCVPEDAGSYKCTARNPEGEATCEALLEIVDKIEKREKAEAPSFLKKIGDCEVYEGMTAKFTACASGYPEPEFEWFRDEIKLFPNERTRMEREGSGLLRLTIRNVDEADVGRYKLRVFNPHGEAYCEADLSYDTLESRPKRPIGDQYVDFDKFRRSGAPLPLSDPPILNLIGDRHLTLSWKPSIPIGPRVPVTYCVEMCECPDGEWSLVRNGIRGCCCDISNLDPYRDYRFRIRVENKFGVSDPSPYASTHRDRLIMEPIVRKTYLDPHTQFHPDSSHYFPKDFDLLRPPHDGYSHAPRFLLQEHESQYGIKNQNCSLIWFVYGYPKPTIKFYFNDELIEMGGRFDFSYTRNGQASLFINCMLDRDVGYYKAVATNEHGEARQRVKLEIAEHPHFVERPQESVFMSRRSGRIQCRITGYPEPEVKWYKDWQPLAPSNRVKIQHIQPDVYILVINDVIVKDEGLYSVVARNPAGAASASAMIHIEESEDEYSFRTYGKGRNIKPRDKPFEEFYDIGDELGRGTQGVTYHAVERVSGRSYAAKVMHGIGELKGSIYNELEILNQLNHRRLVRLHDAYETNRSLTLVTELAAGGDLLDVLTKRTHVSEDEISNYIRQILEGLEHMHGHGIAHLSLTPGDIIFSHPGGDEIKICDFGLARRVLSSKLASLRYGMPEFVSPEIVNGEGVGLPADLWSLGIITYLLLSGISPFRGDTDRDTLRRVQGGQMNFDPEAFANVSDEAKDFIAKLLVFHPSRRMNVREALEHPWIRGALNRPPRDTHTLPVDRLKSYYLRYRDWYSNASCRNWYRKRPLEGAFTHPSCMVYPPGEDYTPRESPEREAHEPRQPSQRDATPQKSFEHPGYDGGIVSSESHYQYGPDTYLLQLRDTDFPVRLREYMKVAMHRSPTFAMRMYDSNYNMNLPIIHERRRFTDIMDEEIDDERRNRIGRYNGETVQFYQPRRLKHELATRPEAHSEADVILEAKREGMAPFFREKPRTVAIAENQPAELSCYAVGDPQPIIQWFKNDVLIIPGQRITILEEGSKSVLRFDPASSFDLGVYKAVARNKSGQTVAKARLVLGDVPSIPDSPEVAEISDTEVLLRWKLPKSDGNSPVLCYSLQFKQPDETQWKDLANNIDHEFFLVRDLLPVKEYHFRLAAYNKFGWSERSIPTNPVLTKESGSAKITITRAMKHLQQLTESGRAVESPEVLPDALNYDIESNPLPVCEANPADSFKFIAEIARGRFSLVLKCANQQTDKLYAAKILKKDEADETREVELMRSLSHERVCSMTQLFAHGDFYVMILEKLQGTDVLTYLSQRHEYTEQMVATIVTNVLDALQYLHWRGLAHLDVQPDNILLTSGRAIDVKLCDMGCARRVSRGGTRVERCSLTDYASPEVLNDEPVYPQSDVWSLGVVTYVLLSGVSPFRGETDDETRQNVTYVRYRFEPLYKEISMEATRFLMLVFKRAPSKRPTVEECLEHRWLQPTEFMLKKRERALFLGNRLKEYCDLYRSQRQRQSTSCENLLSAFGLGLSRSSSMQNDIYTTY